MAKIKDKIVTNISNCARCGEHHVGVVFRRLVKPARDYQLWAMCPKLFEPILMDVKEDKISIHAKKARR